MKKPKKGSLGDHGEVSHVNKKMPKNGSLGDHGEVSHVTVSVIVEVVKQGGLLMQVVA